MVIVSDRSWDRKYVLPGRQWLTPVIPDTQEAEIRRIAVQSQASRIVHKTLSQNPFTKIGLVEWFKVKALGSSPSTIKKKKESMCLRNATAPELADTDMSPFMDYCICGSSYSSCKFRLTPFCFF
jgi:hypothetical protein